MAAESNATRQTQYREDEPEVSDARYITAAKGPPKTAAITQRSRDDRPIPSKRTTNEPGSIWAVRRARAARAASIDTSRR
jgi:hypothetical protein